MSRMFGGSQSGSRMFGGSSGGSVTLEQILDAAVKEKGEPPQKVGVLTRIGNVLQAFEPGGELATAYRVKKKLRKGGMGKGEALRKSLGVAGKQYGEEVIRGLGSALPFLDKYTSPNELADTREGFTEAYEEAYGTPKTKAGKIAQKTAGIAADILVDPGNIYLAGLFKGIGKGAGATTKGVGGMLSKSEKGQDLLKLLSDVTETGKEAFIPSYKAKKVSPELVDTVRTLRRETAIGDREAAELIADLVNENGIDAVRKAAREIDEGEKLSPLAKEITSIIDKATAGEVTLGLRKASVQDYFPRRVVKGPASEYSPKYTRGQGKMSQTLKGAEKKRTFKTRAEGEKAGYQYTDPPEELTFRISTSQRAQKAKNAMNQLIAGEIKDIDGNPLVKALKKKDDLLVDHVPVIIDKTGVKIGEKALKFFPVELTAGKKITAVGSKKAIYQMPKDAAEYLSEAQKVFGNDKATRWAFKVYDKMLRIWKTSVTQFFPAFHVRNMLGNIFNNYIGGVYNIRSYITAGEIQSKTGKLPSSIKKIFPEAETYEDARKILDKLGVTGKGQFAVDIRKYFRKTVKSTDKATQFGKAALQAPRNWGEAIENNARIAHYVEKISKGTKSKEAVKSVNKFLFDYSDLTPFENNILKRIIPFYTFTRKNIPLQLEQIVKQPMKYKVVYDALNGLKSGDLTAEEKKYLPDYVRETFGISIGKSESGDPQFLAGLGLPLEDVSKVGEPIESTIEMINPFIKMFPEIKSKTSLFYEDQGKAQAIRDTRAYNSTTKAIGSIPGLKQFLKAKPAKSSTGVKYYEVDPWRMYALKLFAGRFIQTGERITDERKSLIARVLNTFTGVKIYTPDLEKEKENQILDALRELGKTKTFTTEYVPAERKKELGLPTRSR